MPELKTTPNQEDVKAFVDAIEPAWKKEDCKVLLRLLEKITGEKPKMWNPSIVGYGQYHYKYESGREGDWFLTGFSSRKQNITVYLVGGYAGSENLLNKLGKHQLSVGCLYFKKLADIDITILEQLIIKSVDTLKKRYKEFN